MCDMFLKCTKCLNHKSYWFFAFVVVLFFFVCLFVCYLENNFKVKTIGQQ